MEGTSAVVLDMQCFKDNTNEFILKEVTVVEVDTGVLLLHHIACSPYTRAQLSAEKQRESGWLSKHCHGLTWGQGDIEYSVLVQRLQDCLAYRSAVYVKGTAKKDYVQRYLTSSSSNTTVIDASDLGCESLYLLSGPLTTTTTLQCNQHRTLQSRCALQNCVNLRNWLCLHLQTPVK